jgi:hypothetical protein
VWFLKKYMTISAIPNALAKPRVGDTTINVSVFSIPEKTKAEVPPASNADPMRPPISAWLLDDGRPKYHVIRSQIMAPINPANITSTVENEGCIMPFPTVAATAVPKMNGPAKLAMAAMITAYKGLRTLVPTTVAIEFAES